MAYTGEMKVILTTRRYLAFVDDEDYEKVNSYKWYACVHRNKVYAKRRPYNKETKKYSTLSMHRFILDAPDGVEVDHIDGNGLNNVKSNLRLCTHAQNCLNVKLRSTSRSGYRGISWDAQTSKWRASITHKGKFYDLGRFADIDKAVEVRLNKAKELFGDFA